jgi:2-polyprenyl-3-methyl-5-hydroxy-6-metoxy-1,4-benzoquinol methylase
MNQTQRDNDIEVQELIKPRAPHDDLTFAELSERYNFRNVSSRDRLFVRLLLKEIQGRDKPVHALDIGCGTGISTGPQNTTLLRALANEVDELWGIEPDTAIQPDHGLFTNFQHALLEEADLPENHFDLAYSFMVMEHVADPESFLKAVYRFLKPGGVYLYVTPNGHHYFTRIAGTLKKLKLDELILRLLRGKTVEDYHYPVQYRCNRHKDIHRLGTTSGFMPPQIACVEITGPKPYLPGVLKPIWWLMMKKRATVKNPNILLNLYTRLEKQQAS